MNLTVVIAAALLSIFRWCPLPTTATFHSPGCDTAGQEARTQPHMALPRTDSQSGIPATPGSTIPAAAATPGGHSHHAAAGRQHFAPRSPAISRAPSMISRMSGSFVAPTRFVPGPEEEAVPVGQLGLLEDMERFAARLAHLAPNNAAGQVRARL